MSKILTDAFQVNIINRGLQLFDILLFVLCINKDGLTYFISWYKFTTFFSSFWKNVGGHKSFFMGPVLDFWWCLLRVSKQRHIYHTFPEIHLWCNTYWPPGDQHGSQAIFFHLPVNRHCWGSKLGSIVLLLLKVWTSFVITVRNEVGARFPHPGGGLRGLARGCLQAHTRGSPGPHLGVCIPVCNEADTPPPADGYCFRRYASYWNAFLYWNLFLFWNIYWVQMCCILMTELSKCYFRWTSIMDCNWAIFLADNWQTPLDIYNITIYLYYYLYKNIIYNVQLQS